MRRVTMVVVLFVSVAICKDVLTTTQPSVDDMWSVIENGDKERDLKLSRVLSDSNGNGKGASRKRTYELDIDLRQKEEEMSFQRRRFLIQSDSGGGRPMLPTLFSWHLAIWRTRAIPYTFASGHSASEKETIKNALAYMATELCVKFRRRVYTDKNWIKFYKGTGCHSGIGRIYWRKASTDISLAGGCVRKAIIVHEVLHALGYFHEQSRIDRDSYVNVYLKNVRSGMESNFDKNAVGQVNVEGTSYDAESIMQYGRLSMTNGGGNTMERKFDPNSPLGSNTLSKTDILEFNRHYKCNVKSGWSEWSDFSPYIQQEWGSYHCTRSRVRICMGTGTCAGEDAYGVQEDARDCKEDSRLARSCKHPAIDGHWGNWGAYTKCYAPNNCGLGVQSRLRTCSNPTPSNGGKQCAGSLMQKRLCIDRRCKESDAALGLFKSGDGSSRHGEERLNGNYEDRQACYRACLVKQKTDPTVDGVTYGVIGGSRAKECYCEKSMTGRIASSGVWESAFLTAGGSVDQDFSIGLGQWKSDDFVQRVGPGPNRNIGPQAGISGSGGYAVLSKPSSQYTIRGKLESPRNGMHPNSKKCFIFFYQLNGAWFPKNTFSVYIEFYKTDGSKDYRNVIELNGHQGNYWQRSAFTIPETLYSYKIIFEGKAFGYKNEIAIDSIILLPGECPAALKEGNKDNNAKCKDWALKGFCNDNNSNYNIWMAKNCIKTCSECEDRNAKCGKWSRDGQCTRNVWMLWNCCKSCHNVCRVKDSTICRDTSEPKHAGKCPRWAEQGHCTGSKTKKWMALNCYKSCYEKMKN